MTREEELLDRIDEQKRYIKSLETHIEGLQEKLSDTQKELEKFTTESLNEFEGSSPQEDDAFAMKKAHSKMAMSPSQIKKMIDYELKQLELLDYCSLTT